MRILERLRYQREIQQEFKDALVRNSGNEDAAADEVMATMKERYGLSIDWAALIELIMKIIALFLTPKPTPPTT